MRGHVYDKTMPTSYNSFDVIILSYAVATAVGGMHMWLENAV